MIVNGSEWRMGQIRCFAELRLFRDHNAARMPGKRLDVESEGDQAGRGLRNDWWHFGTIHRTIESVALDRGASGGADQAFEFAARSELGSFCASVVINLFFDHSAVEIVGAEAQGNLRDA